VEEPLQPGHACCGEGVAAAQQQLAVCPRRVFQPAAAALLLARDALPDGRDGVVGKLDQVERIDGDGGTRQLLAQRLAERGRWVDRDDLDPGGAPDW
jgi:hypothetical protein